MRCNDVGAELALFVEGALEAGAQQRVAAHLGDCAACAAEAAAIRALLVDV